MKYKSENKLRVEGERTVRKSLFASQDFEISEDDPIMEREDHNRICCDCWRARYHAPCESSSWTQVYPQ